ncbi:amphi-Trp domain-containing protein [Thermodesulfatator atlanticus]
MAEEKILFKTEEPKSLTEVADFLRALADKLTEGKVVLRKGSEEIALTIPANVVLEMKAEQKIKGHKTKYSLEVEIEWREGDQEGPLTLG